MTVPDHRPPRPRLRKGTEGVKAERPVEPDAPGRLASGLGHATRSPSGPELGGGALSFAVPHGFVEVVAERVAALLGEMQRRASSPWLDVRAAAERLACPRSRVYALVSARRIPHHRDGSRLLFRPEELDEWVRGGGAKRP